MSMVADSVRQLAAALVIGAIVVAALVYGSAILVPLAGATIIAFMLAPVVRWLTARGLPRGAGVGGVLALVLALVVGVTMLLSVELLSLAARMPDYRENIIQKVRTITVLGREGGSIKRATDAIDRLTDEVGRELGRPPEGAAGAPGTARVPVVVQPEGDGASSALRRLEAAGEPIAKTALLLLFTLFLLLQHQDMRDRIIRIFGTDNLSETTSAMTEAGTRLSRLFLAQFLMSAAYGVMVGTVLFIVGLPGALLWGVLSTFMRFVPFIGSYIAAVPPIVLAAGVDPGWGLAIFTASFFLITEAVMGNLVEPMLLGRRVGLSPFAMIAAASFWTLVWGAVGLLLAAPLTMTLVVLGRYVHGLSFVSVLLGDEPALEPEQELYHRLLSRDALSAAEQLETSARSGSLGQTADALVLPALRLAARDASAGRLSEAQQQAIRETLLEATELLPQTSPHSADGDAPSVLVVAARGEIDILAATFLARAIAAVTGRPATASEHSTGLTALSSAMADATGARPAAIAIVTVGNVPRRQIEFIAERATRDFPEARILIVAWPERGASPANPAKPCANTVPSAVELFANLRDDRTSPPSATADASAPAMH